MVHLESSQLFLGGLSTIVRRKPQEQIDINSTEESQQADLKWCQKLANK